MRRHPALIILFFICIKIALGDDEYDRIRAQVFAGAVASDHPILVMMGGGTASGKSSAVKPLQALGFIPVNATHIDPDDVMGMLSGYQAAVRAGDKCAANNFHSMSSKYAKQLFDEALSLSFQVDFRQGGIALLRRDGGVSPRSSTTGRCKLQRLPLP